MNKLKSQNIFIQELINNFPEIKDEVLDKDSVGIITLQIACFKRYTQKAIDNNELEKVSDCFQFVDSSIGFVEPEIENALIVTYLGKLNIPLNSEINKLFSLQLKNIVSELNSYYLSESTKPKLKNFLDNL